MMRVLRMRSPGLIIGILIGGMSMSAQALTRFQENGKWGYQDGQTIVVPAKYDQLGNFEDGLAEVRVNSKTGYVDRQGKEVIPPVYDGIYSFYEGVAQVKQNERYGALERTGKLIIPCENDFVSVYHHGYAYVLKDKRCGLFDRQGHAVVPVSYELVSHSGYRNGDIFPIMLTNEKEALVILPGDKDQLQVKHYEAIFPYEGGSSYSWPRKVKREGKFGFINEIGEEVLPAVYDKVERSKFHQVIYQSGKKGIITNSEHVILPAKYDYIQESHISPLVVGIDGKFGLVDDVGRTVVPLEYDEIEESYDWPKKFKLKGKYGYLDEKARIIVTPQWDAIEPVEEGKPKFYRVATAAKWGIIDGKEKQVLPVKFDAIQGFFGGVARCRVGEDYQYFDQKGKLVLSPSTRFPEGLTVHAMQPANYPLSEEEPIDRQLKSAEGAFQVLAVPEKIPYEMSEKLPQAEIQKYLTVYLINRSEQVAYPQAQDGYVMMQQEAKNQKGVWQVIESWRSATCGNSYYPQPIQPKHQRVTAAPRYAGPFKTKLRLSLFKDKLISNEWEGSVDPKQFDPVEPARSMEKD